MRSWAAVGAASLTSGIAILSCGSRTSVLPVTGSGGGGALEDVLADAEGGFDATPESGLSDVSEEDVSVGDSARADADGSIVKPIACPEPLIYLATMYGTLWSFNPDTSKFVEISTLGCPTASTIYALAADRRGNAYAVYYSGELFLLDMKTGACRSTPYVGSGGPNFLQFGMGFVASNPDGGLGEPETLYVSSIGTPTRLGIIDTTAYTLKALAKIGPASLTGVALSGTGDGRLFGYYNQPPPGDIVQLDPASSQILHDWPVGLTQGQSWGFAFWKEKFYLFTTPDDATSQVHQFDPTSGSLTFVTSAKQLDSLILSATVSTCAPLE